MSSDDTVLIIGFAHVWHVKTVQSAQDITELYKNDDGFLSYRRDLIRNFIRTSEIRISLRAAIELADDIDQKHFKSFGIPVEYGIVVCKIDDDYNPVNFTPEESNFIECQERVFTVEKFNELRNKEIAEHQAAVNKTIEEVANRRDALRYQWLKAQYCASDNGTYNSPTPNELIVTSARFDAIVDEEIERRLALKQGDVAEISEKIHDSEEINNQNK